MAWSKKDLKLIDKRTKSRRRKVLVNNKLENILDFVERKLKKGYDVATNFRVTQIITWYAPEIDKKKYETGKGTKEEWRRMVKSRKVYPVVITTGDKYHYQKNWDDEVIVCGFKLDEEK